MATSTVNSIRCQYCLEPSIPSNRVALHLEALNDSAGNLDQAAALDKMTDLAAMPL